MLDRDVEEAAFSWQLQMVPTGKRLSVLNLSAESSLNNGLRYIMELLLERHNFYLNKCWKLSQESGVDVYTVKTDAPPCPTVVWERQRTC